MVKKINEAEYNELDKNGMILVDFNATWCGPCKMLAPVLEEVSEDYEGKVRFFSVDTDENPSLARSFAIMNIPALILLKDGEKVASNVGFLSDDELCDFIDSNLK